MKRIRKGKKTHMNKGAKSGQLVRLFKDELQRSRAGTLGRFPSDDLYEPEGDDSGNVYDEPELQSEKLLGQEHGESQE